MTKTNEKEAFEQLYQQFLKNDHHISSDVISVLYWIVHNNLKFVFEDRIERNNQYFRLYDILLKKQYIQIKSKISIQFFKCVSTICLELGKYDYLEEFITQYEHKLYLEEFAKDVVMFSRAKLLLYKGDLTQLMDVDFNLHFKDSRFKFEIKRLEAMFNYELQEFSVLESLIIAFQVALTPRRIKHLSESKISQNRNFINYFNKLYRIFVCPDTTDKDIHQLIGAIENVDYIADQKWLIKKAKALLRKE